jgi:hypothetical protein
MSASWNPHDPLQICCGLADGSVAIWNLDAELLTFSSSRKTKTSKPEMQQPESSAIPSASTSNPTDCDTDLSAATLDTIITINTTSKISIARIVVPSIRLIDQTEPTALIPSSSEHIEQSASIRTASFCPFHPHLILTSGYERNIKVDFDSLFWRKLYTTSPLLIRRNIFQSY